MCLESRLNLTMQYNLANAVLAEKSRLKFAFLSKTHMSITRYFTAPFILFLSKNNNFRLNLTPKPIGVFH